MSAPRPDVSSPRSPNARTGLTLLIALGTAATALYVALRHGRFISKAVSSDNPEMHGGGRPGRRDAAVPGS
ncbi:hypothetical protein ACFCYL_18685, partial [Streptomyces sp. NPDC056305]|uniref:hypothetical protein n=1 Tax=Streptomyces sp. NPDC056305 TaxID=3345779 RepID=UPI0035E39238